MFSMVILEITFTNPTLTTQDRKTHRLTTMPSESDAMTMTLCLLSNRPTDTTTRKLYNSEFLVVLLGKSCKDECVAGMADERHELQCSLTASHKHCFFSSSSSFLHQNTPPLNKSTRVSLLNSFNCSFN